MISYEFYRTVHGGTADEAVFLAAAAASETVVRNLLYPTVPEELNAVQTAAFSRAVCIQVDFDLAAGSPGQGRIRSETLGDRSVTYDTDAAGTVRTRGMPVSPLAVLTLENAGCIRRWL